MEYSSKTTKSTKIPLILDTDMSPDSWVAVLFAALHPKADLLAVSVSGTGEAHGQIGARNAQRLLELAGKNNIPVGFGRSDPLIGNEHFPGLMRFVVDHMFWQKPPKIQKSHPLHNSIELIAQILKDSNQKVTFAAVGPQTNLASVLTKYPELKDKVKGVYIMGGALDVPGNIKEIAAWKANENAEWNFFCDPLAAKTIIDSGVPVYLVPLDATNQIPVTRDFINRLSCKTTTLAGKFVFNILTLMVIKLRAGSNFYLWDPITTACALDPDLAQFKKRKVDVVTKAGPEWGQIIYFDKGTEISAAHALDREKFEETIISIVS